MGIQQCVLENESLDTKAVEGEYKWMRKEKWWDTKNYFWEVLSTLWYSRNTTNDWSYIEISMGSVLVTFTPLGLN